MSTVSPSNILPRRIFDCWYGRPFSGKSKNLADLARLVHKLTGKKTRVAVGDGSLLTYEALMEDGVVEAFEFTHRPWPQDTLFKIAEGWFPADPADPNSPLIDPSKNNIKDVGLTIIEGVSVSGAYVMGHVKGGLAWRGAQGEKIGENSAIKMVEAELDPKTGLVIAGSGPGTAFGGNPPSHFGHGQRIIVDAIQKSKTMPCHVVWTAHEVASEQEETFGERGSQTKVRTGETIIGPEVVGKKLTGTIQRMFGNTLHFQTALKAERKSEKDEVTGAGIRSVKMDYRIYTRDHYDAMGQVQVRYLAGTRGVGAEFPEHVDNIEEFLTKLKEEREKQRSL